MKDIWKGLIGGVVIVFVVLFAAGSFTGAPGTTAPPSGQPGQYLGPPSAAAQRCGDNDGYVTLQLSNRNNLNSTLDFMDSTVQAYYSDGTFAGNATLAAGSTEGYRTIKVVCPSSGKVYAFGSTTLNSPPAYDFNVGPGSGPAAYVRMVGTRYINPQITPRNTSGTAVGSASQTANLTSAEGMTTGSTNTKWLDIDPAGTSGAIGHETEGIWLAVDLKDTTKFSVANGISVSGQTIAVESIACPADVASADSADKCYKTPRITSADGIQRLTTVWRSDVGDPTTTNPVIYLETPCFFQDVDGAVKLGVFNTAASRQCGSATSFTLSTA